MGLVSGLLENPLVLGAAVLLGLYFGYRFLAERVRVRVPGGDFSAAGLFERLMGPRWAERKLEREIERLKQQDNYLAAGKLLEDAGRLAAAAEAYVEGQEHWAAAATYEKLGRAERAAELYLQAGDHKKGAALFTAAGKPARAAALFQERGNNLEAARLYAVGNQWTTAAELYEKSGYPLRAAEAWEKGGQLLKAAEAYEKHFMENVSFATTYTSTAPTSESRSALLAGKLFEQAGQPERAIAIYGKGGFHRAGAEALLRAGQPAKASVLFLRAVDAERAASAFEQAGDVVRAATLRGEAAFKADQPAEAAAWFVKGRDFLRAAELYESVGLMAEAAQAYEAGESWAAAGGVYLRGGFKDRAAAAYEKGAELETAADLYAQLGEGRKAAELYARAGFTFKSGEASAQAGDREQAIALLQRVLPSDENHRTATELLARLFIETGRPALAVERVTKAIAGQDVSAANLDLYYWLALAREASGARSEALALLKRIQAEDLQYRDVNERAARLALAPQDGPPPTSPPLPVAPAPVVSSPSPEASLSSAPAARQPRFVPREEIARGPLGVVWRGEDTSDGRSVAMRMIPAALLAAPGLASALAADLKAAAQVSHPNLVKVIAFMEWRGERCLVSELVAGRNFAEAISSGRRMSYQQVHAIGRTTAQVLTVVHGKGLVHGSIQPSNVMVAGGVIKIADLGLARLVRDRDPGQAYHAPEGGVTPADDLYALCAVMYHLLTGTHPRSQPQGVGLPLPSQLAAGVPETMDRLLLRGLHPRPELRLAAAEDLQRELRDMVRIG